MQKKIYYHDTDCGGVVYYSNYLKYLEEARTEFFSEMGVSIKELAAQGTFFVVSRQEIDYKLPAFYGDTLEVYSRINDISAVRIEFEHKILNQHNRIVSLAKTIMVCVDTKLKPQPIAEQIRTSLKERL